MLEALALKNPCHGSMFAGDIPDAGTLRKMLANEPPSHIQDPEILRQEVDVAFTEARDGKTATLQKKLITQGRDWLARLTAYLAVKKFEDAAASSSSSGGSSGLSQVVAEGIVGNESAAAEGASFPAMFAVAMALGALSRYSHHFNHFLCLKIVQLFQILPF